MPSVKSSALPPGSRLKSFSYLGIDPGLKGAIAVYDASCAELVKVERIPIRLHAAASATRKMYDRPALKALLFLLNDSYNLKAAFIERVHSMPNDGKVQAFSFGKGYGILLGMLECMDVPAVEVPSGVWKPSMNLSSDKRRSLALARDLFPRFEHRFKKVSNDDGLAEAALLAYFGATRFK